MTRNSPGFPAFHTLSAWVLAGLLCARLFAKSDPDTRGPDTAGLDLVAPDGPGFITIRVAELFRSPSTKELRDVLAKSMPDFRKKIHRSIGVEIGQVERVTMLLPWAKNEQPVVVVTTAKPFIQETVRKAIIPEGKEKQLNGKTIYYKGAANSGSALYFPGGRVFVISTTHGIETLIKHKPRPKQEGPLSGALAQATRQHHLVAGMSLAHSFFQEAGKDLRKEGKVFQPLLAAQKGILLIVSDGATQGSLRLTYSHQSGAKEAREAVQRSKMVLLKEIGEARKELTKELHNPRVDPLAKYIMEKSLVFCGEVKAGLQGATLRTPTAREVVVALKSKTSAADLVTVSLGWFMVSVSMEAPAGKPDLPPLPAAAAKPARP